MRDIRSSDQPTSTVILNNIEIPVLIELAGSQFATNQYEGREVDYGVLSTMYYFACSMDPGARVDNVERARAIDLCFIAAYLEYVDPELSEEGAQAMLEKSPRIRSVPERVSDIEYLLRTPLTLLSAKDALVPVIMRMLTRSVSEVALSSQSTDSSVIGLRPNALASGAHHLPHTAATPQVSSWSVPPWPSASPQLHQTTAPPQVSSEIVSPWPSASPQLHQTTAPPQVSSEIVSPWPSASPQLHQTTAPPQVSSEIVSPWPSVPLPEPSWVRQQTPAFGLVALDGQIESLPPLPDAGYWGLHGRAPRDQPVPPPTVVWSLGPPETNRETTYYDRLSNGTWCPLNPPRVVHRGEALVASTTEPNISQGLLTTRVGFAFVHQDTSAWFNSLKELKLSSSSKDTDRIVDQKQSENYGRPYSLLNIINQVGDTIVAAYKTIVELALSPVSYTHEALSVSVLALGHAINELCHQNGNLTHFQLKHLHFLLDLQSDLGSLRDTLPLEIDLAPQGFPGGPPGGGGGHGGSRTGTQNVADLVNAYNETNTTTGEGSTWSSNLSEL